MRRSLSEAAGYVIDQLDRLGLGVPTESRLRRMYSAVCNSDGTSRGFIAENDPDFNTALEALRDFSQLEFFFEQVQNEPRRQEYLPTLARVVNDSVQPEDDEQNSPGRDAQAELFMFAVCKNAGTSPLFEEPDITCDLGGRRTGLAVKRVKSVSKLQRRTREATEQIVRSGRPGAISVEITLAVNPENWPIVTNMPENKVRHWWADKMRTLVSQYDGYRDAVVRGIFLHEHCPVRFGTSYALRSMTYAVETAKDPQAQAQWDELRRTTVGGLPNLVR